LIEDVSVDSEGRAASLAALFWRLPARLAETIAGACVSASSYGRAEDIEVVPAVMPELEFRNVERQIFAAHLVERADDPALEDAPEAFNRLGVDRADHVLTGSVVNHGVRIFVAKVLIADPLVSAEQANAVRGGFVHELGEGRSTDVLNDAGHNVALAANSASNGRFAGADAAGPTATAAPVLVAVLGKTCPSSEFLRQRAAPFKGGSGSSGC
jgi:hypothetical protein